MGSFEKKRRDRQPVVYGCRVEGQSFVPVYVSENIKEAWGYDDTDCIGNPAWWLEHVHPEDRERLIVEVPRALKVGCHTHEYRFRHKDGTYRWVYDRLRVVRDEQGRPKEIIGSWLDITEFKPK